jgi:hypothetical protein
MARARAFVAVTDGDWFAELSAPPALDEVNFWQPSGRTREKRRARFSRTASVGRDLEIPRDSAWRPRTDFLRWHNENRFRG